MLFIPNHSCDHICVSPWSPVCHYCDCALLLLWSSCPVDVQSSHPYGGRYSNHLQEQHLFCLDTPAVTEISNKWLNESTRDWFCCGCEYYFIDWDLLWLNMSSFHTLKCFLMLKMLSLSGQEWFHYHIEDTSGNSGRRLYIHGCGPLEQHGKQYHRCLLDLVQILGSSSTLARLWVARRQEKEEYRKKHPMTVILSCAERLLSNTAKCPTLPRQMSCFSVAATYY